MKLFNTAGERCSAAVNFNKKNIIIEGGIIREDDKVLLHSRTEIKAYAANERYFCAVTSSGLLYFYDGTKFYKVDYNKNNQKHPAPSTDVFKQLRIRKLPYAVHYYYSASDIENLKSGEIFKELSKERPLFSFFLSKKSDSVQDTVTEEDKKAVYEIIIKERYWLTYPSIPFAI